MLNVGGRTEDASYMRKRLRGASLRKSCRFCIKPLHSYTWASSIAQSKFVAPNISSAMQTSGTASFLGLGKQNEAWLIVSNSAVIFYCTSRLSMKLAHWQWHDDGWLIYTRCLVQDLGITFCPKRNTYSLRVHIKHCSCDTCPFLEPLIPFIEPLNTLRIIAMKPCPISINTVVISA